MKNFYLKIEREKASLSIRGLAKKAGINHDFIAKSERGMAHLSKESLTKVALALGLDVNVVLVAYGFLPSYTEESRVKNPHLINKAIEKVSKKIMESEQ